MGTFDTALMEALLSVGISPERARAVVDSFDRSIDSRYGLHAQVLATKRDLAETQTRLMREIGESRERIASLAARIAETKTDLLKWTLGALTAQTALLLSAMKLL